MLAVTLFNSSAHSQTNETRANRSAFEYVDQDRPPASRYLVPKSPVDPTDVTLENLKAQIVALEERVERLEEALKAKSP